MKYSVAIDIGGTNTRVALADEELNIIERKQFATDSENPDVTLGKIAECWKILHYKKMVTFYENLNVTIFLILQSELSSY